MSSITSNLTVASNPVTPTPNSLYITLQYLRSQNGRHLYHWGLYSTDSRPPAGHLIHATDTGRQGLDLYREIRVVSNPLKSSTMVVCLKIADSPGILALDFCSQLGMVHLMDSRYLPRNEPVWTCRVWVKEVLNALQGRKKIQLPKPVDEIEQSCIRMADSNLQHMGTARVFNDQNWLEKQPTTRTSPMEIDSTGNPSGGRDLGSTPMDIDWTGGQYYGPKPMVTQTYTGTRY